MKKKITYLNSKDFYSMISWRRELCKIKVDNDLINRQLQDILGIRGKGHGDKFIKVGIWLLITPLIGISDILGGIFIGLGLILKAFTTKKYSVTRIGRDLKLSIEFIKRFDANY